MSYTVEDSFNQYQRIVLFNRGTVKGVRTPKGQIAFKLPAGVTLASLGWEPIMRMRTTTPSTETNPTTWQEQPGVSKSLAGVPTTTFEFLATANDKVWYQAYCRNQLAPYDYEDYTAAYGKGILPFIIVDVLANTGKIPTTTDELDKCSYTYGFFDTNVGLGGEATDDVATFTSNPTAGSAQVDISDTDTPNMQLLTFGSHRANDVPVTSIALAADTASIAVGAKATITATVTPTTATYGEKVYFTNGTPATGALDITSGIKCTITGAAAGTTVVTATDPTGSVTGTITITVTAS